MVREYDIPPKSTAIIDSSVLFAMGSPDNEKYRAFEKFVMGRGLTVKIPKQVAEELGEAPEAYAYQRERLQAAQSAGWLQSGQIDFSNPRVSEVVGKTRERMATLSAAGRHRRRNRADGHRTLGAGVSVRYG